MIFMDEMKKYKAALEQEAERDGVPIIRASERKVFLNVAENVTPKRILEIGTAIGYSALLLAERFPCAVVDTIEADRIRYERAVKMTKELSLSHRIHCFLGDAIEVIPVLHGTYDFVYLDGPKGQYLNHLRLIEPFLAEESTIVADNVLFRGMVESGEYPPHRYRTLVLRLREYLAYVRKHYDTTVYEKGDGLAVSVKRK